MPLSRIGLGLEGGGGPSLQTSGDMEQGIPLKLTKVSWHEELEEFHRIVPFFC